MKWFKKLAKSAVKGEKRDETNDFVKVFTLPVGQVLIEMEYPIYQEEPFVLIQRTVIRQIVKGKITAEFLNEIQMRKAFEEFDYEKAVLFNDQVNKLI